MEHAGPAWLLALEQSFAGQYVRDAVLLYPLANVAHVLAVLVFFAAVAVMDFALLGLLPGAPARIMARFRRLAVAAFGVLVLTGSVLFLPEASAVAANPAFLVKLGLIFLGLANVRLLGWAMQGAGADVPVLARACAVVSLLVWLLVAACGRFIAYA